MEKAARVCGAGKRGTLKPIEVQAATSDGNKARRILSAPCGVRIPPHPPKRPFVGVVALSTNKVQPSAATASVWQHAAFGKGQRRATGPRQFDSAEPHQRSLQICMVSISCYGQCGENAVIMTRIRRFAPCPPSDDFPRWNETSASGSGVVGRI